MPAMIPALIVGGMGATNAILGWLTIAFGFILEIGLTYVFVYFPARYLFRRCYEMRAHRAVAQLGAPPNGGSTRPTGDPNASGGPPSVS